MTLDLFLKQPFAANFQLISNVTNLKDIPIEYISTLEPPAETFVRTNEVILSTAISVRDDPDSYYNFILDLHNAGAAAVVLAHPNDDMTMLESILPKINNLGFPVITATWNVLFAEIVEQTIPLIWENDKQTHSFMESVQRDLLNYFIEGKTLDDAAELLYSRLKCDIIILDCNHKIIGRNIRTRNLTPYGFLESRTNDLSRIVISSFEKLYGYLLVDSSVYAEKIHQPSHVQCLSTPLTLWSDREYSIIASKMKRRQAFVWKLAQHDYISKPDIFAKANYLEFNINIKYACLVAKVSLETSANKQHASYIYHSTNTMIEEQVFELAHDMGLSVMTALNKETLIIFLECKEDTDFQSITNEYITVLEQIFQIAIPSMHFLWGYDTQPYFIYELYKGYDHAKKALETCIISNGIVKRSCFQLSILQRILSLAHNDAEIITLSQNILKGLIDYDKEKNSDFLNTLKFYCKCNYNVSEAARLCHLHRQSFIYRLSKIEELTGLSISSHEDLLLLELCCRILEYQ